MDTTNTITESSSRIALLRCLSVKEKELDDDQQLHSTTLPITSPVSITLASHVNGFSTPATLARFTATVSPRPPILYPNQVGGHGSILASAPGRILKPSNDKERFFYESIFSSFSASTSSSRHSSQVCASASQDSQQQHHILRAHIPIYYGTHSRHNKFAGHRDPKASGTIRWIELQDMNAALHTPCMLDLKIGTRHYDNDASPEKIARTKKTALATTTAATGLRLVGMRFTDNVTGATTVVDKTYGKKLQADELGFQLERFFQLDGTDTRADGFNRGGDMNRDCHEQQPQQHQGSRRIYKDARIRIVKCVLGKVERILADMTQINDWNFYSSSLLIVYDAHDSSTDINSDLNIDGQISLVEVALTASSSTSNSASGTPLAASHCIDQAGGAVDKATLADVKMIDFAHAVRCQAEETRDDGYVFGLVNLRLLLRGIIEKHEQVTG